MFERTLTREARNILARISALSEMADFYLAGGSAAALHLGHRVSIDLDFFAQCDEYEPEPVLRSLASAGKVTIQQQGPGTLVAIVTGVQASFFAYPYPVLQPFESFDRARVASLLDIALMKVVAISQRGRMRKRTRRRACLRRFPGRR